MKKINELKETLKHQAQTTCDKCGAPMEYHLNGYLVALAQLSEGGAKRDFDEIQSLMEKHQCSYDELVNAYESLSLSASPCERCEILEREEAENQFDEWISMKIENDPNYIKKTLTYNIWKDFAGPEGTSLSYDYFEKILEEHSNKTRKERTI